jgi:23S rRNA pseudouridine955/2504/2580 synthase
VSENDRRLPRADADSRTLAVGFEETARELSPIPVSVIFRRRIQDKVRSQDAPDKGCVGMFRRCHSMARRKTNKLGRAIPKDLLQNQRDKSITDLSARPKPPTASKVAQPAVTMVTIDEAHAGQRIDNFLLGHLKGVPKSHVYRILRSGEVRVNKGRIDQTYRLADGDIVRVPPVRVAETAANLADKQSANRVGQIQPKSSQSARQSLRFIFEDEALLAIDKPAGMAVHGGSGISMGVIETLREMRPEAKFLELVHRLDRETSGVLLIAKKRAALVAMHAMLRGDISGAAGKIEKHYFALVQGDWKDAKKHVRIKLAKYVTAAGERRVAVDEDDGQEAYTVFTRQSSHGATGQLATLLDCDIRTGRTHQIRVHLASLGFPILGDDKYGDFALNKKIAAAKNGGLKRMFLHARSIAFAHPVSGEKLKIEAPLPNELAKFVRYLDTQTGAEE